MASIYASFRDTDAAERAAGALLDFGGRREDISIIANEHAAYGTDRSAAYEASKAESQAKEGLTTTTPADVAVGAVKGAAAGAGLGLAAALAALFVPGIGWVLGGGALATALAAAAGTAAAGTAAGGVVGYLKDQGVSEEYVTRYSETLHEGGAILALAVPSGELSSAEAEGILTKYGAINVGTFYAQQAAKVVAPAIDTTRIPTTPAAIPATVPAQPAQTVVQKTQTPYGTVQETVVEQPVVPAPTGPQVIVGQTPQTNDPLAPATTVVVDPNTGVRRSVTVDPVTGLQTSAVVDPVTGEALPSTVTTVQTQGANATEHQSVTGAIPGTPVVATPPITEPTVVNSPVVQKKTVYDEAGNPIGETEVVEDQTVIVDPNRPKLL
ncbi:MAG TPA: hypothetical protein VGE01_01105 [Fimbriimonas sp.]